MDLVNFLLPKIEHFRMLGYWALLMVSLLESLAFVGLVFPGSTFVVLMGALSARGYWDLGDLIWFATVGAILGDGISYSLGKRGKILFTESSRIFRVSYLERGEAFFRKHGPKSVFLGRFLGPIRAIIPFIAGLSRMEPRQFYVWNILSAIAWASSHLLVGYLFGNVWNMIEIWSGRAGFLLAVIVLFLTGSYLAERFILTKGKQLMEWASAGVMSIVRRISEIPKIRSVIDTNPGLFTALSNRLNTGTFTGLPLTLLGIAFLYILLAFLGVLEGIINHESIVAVDTRFANLLYAYRSATVVKVFLWITLLGKAQIILCLALVATVLFWLWNKRAYILPLWISIGACYLTTVLGKVVLHRQRPPGIGVYDETFYSFPSGHATVSTALYGFIAYYLIRHIVTWRNRLNFSFAVIMLVAAVGFSRLYLGVHYLSDVLGGYLLGLIWLIIGICLTELLAERKPDSQLRSISPQILRISTGLLLLACAVFYVHTGLRYHPAKHPALEEEAGKVVVENIVTGFEGLHLPRHTESITAKEGKPLHLVIIAADDASLTSAMLKAGWLLPDSISFGSVTRFAATGFQRGSYLTAPITPVFWNGRSHEFSFVKPGSNGTPGMRHEARFWRTRLSSPDGRATYVGLVTRTAGFKWKVIPVPSPVIDRDRDGLSHDLHAANQVVSDNDELFVKPVIRQDSGEQKYLTEGLICIITLR
jgi:undecaprenyl-diphosphatase